MGKARALLLVLAFVGPVIMRRLRKPLEARVERHHADATQGDDDEKGPGDQTTDRQKQVDV